jgi:hypothetical protein
MQTLRVVVCLRFGRNCELFRRVVRGVTPPAEVEAARATTERRAPRLRPIGEHPLDVRVNAFLRLADDKEVQDAVVPDTANGTNRDT